MIHIVPFLTGFGFALIGSLYIISYLNLMTIGYNFLDYVKFIISKVECWNLVFGFILIWISIGKENYKK
jgi:hypothetical protein